MADEKPKAFHYVWTGGGGAKASILQAERGICYHPGDVLPEELGAAELQHYPGLVELRPGEAEPSPPRAPMHTYVPPAKQRPGTLEVTPELIAALGRFLATEAGQEAAAAARHDRAVGPRVVAEREAEARRAERAAAAEHEAAAKRVASKPKGGVSGGSGEAA